MQDVYLEARFNRSSKFYEMILNENVITIHYGKISGKEKETIKQFHDSTRAELYFHKKLDKQLAKRYIKASRKVQLKFDFYSI